MRKLYFAPIIGCLLLFVPEMFGQTAAPQPSSSEGWQFQVVPYLWGLSLDGRVGVGDRSADVNASFSNILDHLHFTLMGMGDATWNNKIVLLTDALYSDLRGYPRPLARCFRVSIRIRNYSFSLRRAATASSTSARGIWMSSVASGTGI